MAVPTDVDLRVLVVDDSEIVAAAVSRVLQREGFEVTVARSCAEARQCAWLGPFLVSIVDLALPDGSGIDLAEWMGREKCACMSVFHTGNAIDGSEAERARHLGPVFPKGGPPHELVAIVASAAQGALREAAVKLERIVRRQSFPSLRVLRSEAPCSSRPSAPPHRRARRRKRTSTP